MKTRLGQEKAVLVKIPLRYALASELAKQAKGAGAGTPLSLGMLNLIASDIDSTLIFQGTPAGLEALKALVRELDILPQLLELKVQFVQQGKNQIYLRLTINNNQQVSITVGEGAAGKRLSIRPHVDAEAKTVSFQVSYMLGDSEQALASVKPLVTKTSKLGQEARLVLPEGPLFLTATPLEK